MCARGARRKRSRSRRAAGVLRAGGIFGTPVIASVFARALTVFGMVIGAVGVGGLFAIADAAAGAAVRPPSHHPIGQGHPRHPAEFRQGARG